MSACFMGLPDWRFTFLCVGFRNGKAKGWTAAENYTGITGYRLRGVKENGYQA